MTPGVPTEEPKRARSRWRARALIGLLLVIALGFGTFQWVLVPYRIQGRSMEPTLHGDPEGSQDIVLVNRLAYSLSSPARWDIVVLRSPEIRGELHPGESVKRVVGLPGETVEIRDGRLLIDGRELQRPGARGGEVTVSKGPYGHRPVRLGENEFFVLGDNSYLSLDSRAYGAIPRETVVGRVVLVVLPGARFGRAP